MPNLIELTGYVVLYIEGDRPRMLNNHIYPSITGAKTAAEESCLGTYSVNAAKVIVTSPAIQQPEGE